jgi:hypothetical protein
MMIKRFTIAFITIISFACKQHSEKKTDVNTAGKEVRLSLVNAPSLLVSQVITANQNKIMADKPSCCKKIPSRFKLNASDLKKFSTLKSSNKELPAL